MEGEIRKLTQGAAELWIDGVNVGYTKDPVTQTINREYFDVKVEQIKGTIKTEMIDEDMTISTSLSEVSLDNLRRVWDQGGSTLIGGTFLAIGTELGANEHTITIVTKAPEIAGDDMYDNYHVFKAVSYESVETSFAKGENTIIPVTFKCLKDVLNDNRFGYISRSAAKGG